MFGIYRYLLAWMVVYTHVAGYIGTHLNWYGPYAVYCFYMLSGYLMTLILQGHYSRQDLGFGHYLVNRLLRIYPPYWAALAISALVAWQLPRDSFLASPFYKLPQDSYEWFLNVVVVGLHGPVIRVVAPAWTLSVEVIYYVAMGVLLSRSRRTVMIWFAASFVYVAVRLALGWPIYRDASIVLAGTLPFAAGAAMNFVPARGLPPWGLATAALLFAANTVFAADLWDDPHSEGVVVSLALGAVLLYGLRSLDMKTAIMRRLDKLAGDLAYPIFLCHMAVMSLVIFGLFGSHRPKEGTLFLAMIVPVHVLSYLMHLAIVAPLEPLRRRIGGRSQVAHRSHPRPEQEDAVSG